jgi:nucleoid DNA-binding protein
MATRKPKTVKKATRKSPAKAVKAVKAVKTKAKAKPTAAKRVVKKVVAKKAPAATTARASSSAVGAPTLTRVSVGNKPFSKSELIATLSGRTGIGRKHVQQVLDALQEVIQVHLNKQGPEMFVWPGMAKIKVVKKPATKARKGTNPFTGEEMMFKAKPASRKVKILPLKKLKEMAA